MYKKLFLIPLLFILISCGNNDLPATTENTLTTPGWPMVFQGIALVNGKDIPAGIQIYAKLGNHRSLIAETESGMYWNIVIGSKKDSDYGEFITFHLGSPDSNSVQAKEKYKMLKSNEPVRIKLDLDFPKLP